jgi:hypothetical protein
MYNEIVEFLPFLFLIYIISGLYLHTVKHTSIWVKFQFLSPMKYLLWLHTCLYTSKLYFA